MFRENTNKTAVIALLVVIGLLLWKGMATTAPLTEKDTISVSSTSTIEAQPDKAEVYLKVETVRPNPQQSQEDNSRISDKVINALKGEGAQDKDVETTQYTLEQKIRYGQNGEQIIEGYSTTHVIRLTTTETTQAGRFIDAAINAGANGVNSVVFTVSPEKEAELKNQAIAAASADARAKAAKIAQGLGVKLGKLHTAQESSYFIPYYAPLAEKSTQATTIQPQAVQVTASLSVSYSIA